MPRVSVIFFIGFAVLMSARLTAADAMDARLCNIQAREIALRISEELDSEFSARERSQISTIAEEVCLDLANEFSGPDSNGLTENTPSGTSPNDNNPADSVQSRPQVDENEAEDGGLLGDLRIIDSEDRVRRPGLKRR